jgi:hypothetical protein
MPPAKMDVLVDKLVAASRKKVVDPVTDIPWTEKADLEAWYTAPEYVSLFGTPVWEALDEKGRKKLAFHEAAHFYSINIHGEKALMQGLAKRLYRVRTTDVTPYLHHFLDEENRHSMYFGHFCTEYNGRVYPDRKMEFPQELSPEEDDLVFFVKVMIFEELVDVYNCDMGWNKALHPVAQAINKLHHIDEARHLIFGREVVKLLLAACAAKWTPERAAEMRGYFEGYIHSTWQEYYNPDVYKDAGIADPHDVREMAWAHPACVAHRRRVSQNVVKFMLENKLLEKEPDFAPQA